MKKQRNSKPNKSRNTRKQSDENSPRHERLISRRNSLRLIRNILIGVSAIGGTSYVFASQVLNEMHEHDLERIHNGRPTIVQIHDPNCRLCLSLQRETRSALKMMEPDILDYVVANIRTEKGASFANRHGVQHVTLLLFDKNGELKRILEGQRGSHELKRAFERLVSDRGSNHVNEF